jgi:hypothetical protein
LTLNVSATDVDNGQTLNFAAMNLPSGATFSQISATSWQMNWTPTFAQAGAYTISFKVTDSGNPALSQTREVAVDAGVLWAKLSGPEGGRLTFFYFSGGSVVFAGSSRSGLLRSTDDGRTWSAPKAISTLPGPAKAGAGVPIGFHAATAPDGTVYAVWAQGKRLMLAVSPDGGATFERSRPVLETTLVWPLLVSDMLYANGFPSIAVDPSGRIYLCWGDKRTGDLDILAATSADGFGEELPPAEV